MLKVLGEIQKGHLPNSNSVIELSNLLGSDNPPCKYRVNLRINNQQDASSIQNFILSRNSTCFGHLLCPSSGFISCTRGRLEQPDSPRQRPHNLHETRQFPRLQLITPDDGHSRCPKPVEFRDKIKFWILDASCWLFIRRLS
jgi:hypothetical protein